LPEADSTQLRLRAARKFDKGWLRLARAEDKTMRAGSRIGGFLVIAGLIASWAHLGSFESHAATGAELGTISGSPDEPRRHFRLRHPAELDQEAAEQIYLQVVAALAAGYARSALPVAQEYQSWRRYNTAPYLSATHGNKYLSNYVNETGVGYGQYEDAGEMPVGTVIAKDSFSMTQSREILLGPLFVMEKMPAGFNAISGDWKYTQIQPDGTLLGETNGDGSASVRYCIGCHSAVAQQDHLFFIPSSYRVRQAETE